MEFIIEKIEDAGIISRDLLLLADPSLTQIQTYLDSSTILAIRETSSSSKRIVGVIFIKKMSSGNSWEVMNLAVDESFQRRGFGRQLLMAAIAFLKRLGAEYLHIATGNSSTHQLKLYQECGFEISKVIPNYFREHYSDPIYENGIECRDRIELVKLLSKTN